ncbi:leucyl aminopeptidase [Gammaproteobacteria bacterium]|jgi:leucyl aminopeptidase|nr:leucyl aminopeptidase [Gammaproteobacteria bacterium]GIS22233.1 MAG: putative cytosol aminopeptidase [Gammaproteobacteria bacterium]
MKKLLNQSISSNKKLNFKKDKFQTLIIGVSEAKTLDGDLKVINEVSNGTIKKLISREEITGKIGNSVYLPAISGVNAEKSYFVGTGKKNKKISEVDYFKICQSISSAALASKSASVKIIIPEVSVENRDTSWTVEVLGRHLEASSYQYFFKGKKNQPKNVLKKVEIFMDSKKAGLSGALKKGQIIGAGSNFSKELANTPANICTPTHLANQARALSRTFSAVKTKVLGEKEMKKLGMDCLLSVGNGSVQESKLIIMNYAGGKKDEQPHVIVGKGITFDTGGISIKPSRAMDEMKYDMSGAASVLGTMRAIAEIKPKKNIIGVIASAENMPSGTATKPGDVVSTMSGQTVEILNTDAEGRLVLCDALTYVERFKPASVIDIATLTGAVIVALGHEATGVMSNDQKLADKILSSGIASGDKAWQLPLWDEYQGGLKSRYADIANIGGSAGTITAACFLSRFTEKYKWAHLDIAGTAYGIGGQKVSSGRPVPLLSEYLLTA